MSKDGPTIYDVAKKAGVSIATVSNVLNAPGRVRERTRKKVLEAIQQLNFVPKAEASARAMKSLGRIGVLTSSITLPSFVERLRGIVNALDGTEYELITYSARTLEQCQWHLDMLSVSKRVDGLIVMTLPVKEEALQRVTENGIEVVSIEVPNPLCCSIHIDNVLGGQLAAEYLLPKNYQTYAYIGESRPGVTGSSKKRLQGFRQRLQKAGKELSEPYIRLFPFEMSSVIQQTEKLLDLSPRPNAIFAYSDMYAIGVLKAARMRQIRVPEELAVIGFDNIDTADFMDITTIDQHLEESGRIAVETLFAQLSGKKQVIQNIEIGIQVKVRSTA